MKKVTELDEFLRILSNYENIDSNILQDDINSEEFTYKVKLLITFFQPGYEETVWNGLEKCENKELILENLMKLYPLSQNLVFYILRRSENYEEFFVRGLDIKERVYKCIKDIISEMRSKAGKDRLTKRFEDYEHDIKCLEERVEELKSNISKEKEYLEKKQKLEEEYCNLKQESSQEMRDAKIEELNKQINELQMKKKRFEKEYDGKQKNLAKLKKELAEDKDKLESEDEKRLLKELLKKFPKDEGGDIV